MYQKRPFMRRFARENMLGIKIQDKRQSSNGRFLSFDLRDILAVIGEPVKQSKWLCYNLCYTAKRNGMFNEFRESRLKLSGGELIELASEIHQTIDGRFEAKTEGATKKPYLVIVAFDSSWFEVYSSKSGIIDKLKNHFQMVSDITTALGQLVV
jgi:hypothetical protein